MPPADTPSTPQTEGKPPQPNVIVVPTVVVPVVVPVAVPVPVPISSEAAPSAPALPSVTPQDPDISAPPVIAPPGPLALWWRKFGGTGFIISALLHFSLIIFALFWVFSEIAPSRPRETAFISGSGGSSVVRGISKNLSEKAFRRLPPTESPKILSKGKSTALRLPELPKMNTMKRLDLGKIGRGGNADFGKDSSDEIGVGGGIGAGIGVGIGNGKNHLGKFKTLLGAKIKAQRIAVYLDCSGSMQSYLPAVKAEIYEKFPDADVFAFSGAGTEIHDGEIVGGRNMKAKTLATLKRKRANDETETAKLSGQGRVIYKKYATHFAAGTTGAWLDILSRERYDALVVFSDFRDGIRQKRKGKTVFADSSYAPKDDTRTPQERAWEKNWLNIFSKKNAPKLYFFSVRSRPQAFLEKCVTASQGEITILD